MRTRARVMSLFGGFVVLTAAAAGLMTSTGSASAQPSTAETARCTGTHEPYYLPFDRDSKLAQPFTASVAGPPASVDVPISRPSTAVTEPATVSIRAWDDATGQPGAVFASAVVPADTIPVANDQSSPTPPTTVRFDSATTVTAGGRYALELTSTTSGVGLSSYHVDRISGSTCGGFHYTYRSAYMPGTSTFSVLFVARVGVATPPDEAVSVRGGGTLSAGNGQRYSLSVDARATAGGQVSGRFALAGGGSDTTAGSRTVDSVIRTSSGSTVSGTATTGSGRTAPFTLTVIDKPGGKDQVTVRIGSTTVSGTLSSGDITTS